MSISLHKSNLLFQILVSFLHLSATFYTYNAASSHLEISSRPRTFTGGLPVSVLISLPAAGEAAFLTGQVVKVVHWTLRAVYDTASSEVRIVSTLGAGCRLRTSGWAIVTYKDSGL
jgi:hypothetical protein